ncbi:MAG TPA: GspE/PulE family protein [Methylomirabilota bacterium]|nr:GspE/PulE family protein [Methylomirabilota bacterium]
MAPESISALQERLAYEQKLIALVDRIHAAKSLDDIFLELQAEILGATDGERLTLFAVDPEKRELYSRLASGPSSELREIRVPVNEKSIVGFVASSRSPLNIIDAYDKNELTRLAPSLAFDNTWDSKSGFRTKQVLAIPVFHDNRVVGVMQLLNKKRGPRFTREDESSLARIAKTLGIALHNQIHLAQKRGGKFDYLLAHHLITQEELNHANAEARRRQVDVETILLEQSKIPKSELGAALSQFYRCPFIEYDDKVIPPPDLMRDLKLEYLKKTLWLPLRRDDRGLTVLVDNPQDIQKIDTIQQLLPRHKINLAVGLRNDILMFLGAASGELTPKGSLGEILGDLKGDEGPDRDEISAAELDENDSAIIRLANQLIVDAYRARASDIHIEPYGSQRDTVIRIRVDGSCTEYQRVPGAYRRAIVARIKIMAQLDIAERRKPQDGKIKFRLPDNRDIELRVATVPTAGGNEDVVMRILASNEPIPIDKLGMTDRNLRELKIIAEKPYGLILVVGPTGSGKTTTLHSVLGFINRPDRKIWTAEDPVEITQWGLRQVQVNPKIGLTFASTMRSFLRADPDVIMVGEMRDQETAETGIEASLTGHLVCSTLHTNSAVETIVRLLDMGLDPFNFADALLGVAAQRLVKRICDSCKERYHPDRTEFEALTQAYGKEEFEALGHRYDDRFTLFRGRGCAQCNNSGYRGRGGIHELLIASDEIKRLIQIKARTAEIFTQAKSEGMSTLVQDGILKSLSGLTDFRQVKAVAIK